MRQQFIIINTKNAPVPMGPYVQAIDTGSIIFISGQIGMHPNTKIIPEKVYDQTQQTLQNIKQIVEKAGLSVLNIVKTTLFITNLNDLLTINNSYQNFFDTYHTCNNKNYPARSCIEVSKLPKNTKIEIEAIAAY